MTGVSKLTTFIRPKEASRRTGLSTVTLWRYERVDNFPPRVQLGEHSVGYDEQLVDEWIKSRVRAAAGRFRGRPIWLDKTAAPETVSPQAHLPDDPQLAAERPVQARLVEREPRGPGRPRKP
jgi:predicted DNA-binding transcriptional regulator AlpA